jgi:ankyrin repeat protein
MKLGKNHLQQISEIVHLLKISGADVEARTSIIPGLTPAMRAAEICANNGGVLAAPVEAGANITETRGVCGDSALHSWAQTPSECIQSPAPYVMDVIFQKMVNVSLRNDMQESPLHIVASTESSNEQFIQNVKALLSEILPKDINAFDRDGKTPLYHALLGRRNPTARAELLLASSLPPRETIISSLQ